MSDKVRIIKFKIIFEFPYWINLRTGKYTFSHYNLLKQELNKEKLIPSQKMKDKEDYTIELDNFLWATGISNIAYLNRNFIKEDLETETIVNELELKKLFGDKNVYFRKPKTVISKNYIIEVIDEKEKNPSINELIQALSEPIKSDFILALNEFIQIYLGYFSTKELCNDAFLLGDSSFSIDKVIIQIEHNDEDITEQIGFPLGFYSHPAYPIAFPSLEKEKKFFELLHDHKYPSFTKILMGMSNNQFLYGDIRIGILYLDMALESCINDFINSYNEKTQNQNNKIRKIGKNHTLGDFIREDLDNILLNIFGFEDQDYVNSIFKFHEERNLIIHKKKKSKNPEIETMRDNVIDLIEKLEEFMNNPKVIEDVKKDFIKNPLGYFLETKEPKENPQTVKIRIFKTFSEMVKYKTPSESNKS